MVELSTFHVLLPLLFIAVTVHCLEDRKVVPLHKLQWGEESTPHSMVTSTKSSRGEKGGAAVLELKHQTHTSDLPTHSGETLDIYHHNLFVSDEARVSSLQSHIKSGASQTSIPLTSGAKLQTLNYVVTIKLGNKNATVVVDTGSDLTWIQCKPCINCYNQQEPLYDPTTSQSYLPVPCSSPTCISLRSATGAPGNCSGSPSNCYYTIEYGDGSYTRGVLAQEKLELGGNGATTAVVDRFIFGCGRNNHGLLGVTAGIMGLGRTNLSLISQTSAQFGGVFSYCLPSTSSAVGSLVIGDNNSLYRNTTPIQYTRLISDPQSVMPLPYYFANLTSVSVGGVRLGAPGRGGRKVIIDSGTVITRVAPSVYMALKAEFLRQFAGYPSAPGFSILDTCFDLSRYEEVSVPTVSLGFEGGVVVEVDVTGVLYFVRKDATQVCMAVSSLKNEDDVGIVGNYQQRNLRVVYDNVGSRLGFAAEDCGS